MIAIHKTKVGKIILGLFGLALILGAAAPAFALDIGVQGQATAGGTGAAADAKIQLRIDKAKERAGQEIERRINALSDLNTRVQAMARVSASQKATIASNVSTQVSALTSLKTKIDADTELSVLKTDIASITSSYRIFMLIIPQGRITVAADKVTTVTTSLTALAAKLKTKIDAAAAAGKDVTVMTASYNDMNMQIANANIEATSAVTLVASLTPDNGDKAKADANQKALKDARAKVKAGLKDIEAARADARAIIKALKEMKIETNASANSEVNTQGGTQ